MAHYVPYALSIGQKTRCKSDFYLIDILEDRTINGDRRIWVSPVNILVTGGLLAILMALAGCQGAQPAVRGTLSADDGSDAVMQYSADPMLVAHVCKPAGPGPFPAVIYNHGLRSGDSQGTCRALAEAGFLGVAPILRDTREVEGQFQDVLAALSFTGNLEYVQPDRIGMIGYSRGGLLTLMSAVGGGGLRALVLMAPAPGRGHLDQALTNASAVEAPVLVMVAQNDTVEYRGRSVNMVEISRRVESVLNASGRSVQLIVFPPYGSRGHALFRSVRPQYWNDVVAFLGANL